MGVILGAHFYRKGGPRELLLGISAAVRASGSSDIFLLAESKVWRCVGMRNYAIGLGLAHAELLILAVKLSLFVDKHG